MLYPEVWPYDRFNANLFVLNLIIIVIIIKTTKPIIITILFNNSNNKQGPVPQKPVNTNQAFGLLLDYISEPSIN